MLPLSVLVPRALTTWLVQGLIPKSQHLAWAPCPVPPISPLQPPHPCLVYSGSSSSGPWAPVPDSILSVPQPLPTPVPPLAHGIILHLVSTSCSKHGACDSNLPAAPCDQTSVPLVAGTGVQVGTCLACARVLPWHTDGVCSPKKCREVQTCSMGLASSQTYLLKASKSTLSRFNHSFYKAHPLTKCGWTCTETAQRSCSLTQLLVLAPKLWEDTKFFSSKHVPESAP